MLAPPAELVPDALQEPSILRFHMRANILGLFLRAASATFHRASPDCGASLSTDCAHLDLVLKAPNGYDMSQGSMVF